MHKYRLSVHGSNVLAVIMTLYMFYYFNRIYKQKFSIVIDSPRACECPNYRYPISTFSWLDYLWLDTYVIQTSITCPWMASFLMFPAVFKTYGKRYWLFLPKRSSQKTFLTSKFVIGTIN